MTVPEKAAEAGNLRKLDLVEPEDAGIEDSAGGEEPVEEGAPGWMTTFGDMMSLLLTFFILLFSMSEIEVNKFKTAMNSIHEGFGESPVELFDNPKPTPPAPVSRMIARRVVEERATMRLNEIAALLEAFVKQHDLTSLAVVRDTAGVFLRIQDVALFRPGSAVINRGSEWVLDELALVTLGISVPVIVAGHTDDVPIGNSRFASNWELSAARAAGVARALVKAGQDPSTITVQAYGEFRPIASNETEEGRSRNRRVELFYSRDILVAELEREKAAPPRPTPGRGKGEEGREKREGLFAR